MVEVARLNPGKEEAWQQQVRELTLLCLSQNSSSLVWATQIRRCLQKEGLLMPNVELAELLVSLLWSNPGPTIWKYLEHAMASWLVYPVVILAILASRVILYRKFQPENYRLYLELAHQYAFCFDIETMESQREKIMNVMGEALQLPQCYGIPVIELGQALVLFHFTLFSDLVDATAEDSGFHVRWPGNKCRLSREVNHYNGMPNEYDTKGQEYSENLKEKNIMVAADLILKMVQHKRTSCAIYITCLHMHAQKQWLCQRMKTLESDSVHSNTVVSDMLQSSLNICLKKISKPKHHLFCSGHRATSFIDSFHKTSAFQHDYVLGRSSSWIPFDLFLENIMDGRKLLTVSAVDNLAGLTKSLKAAYCASWHDVFLGLWTSALRLVQREPVSFEGPIPHLDSRLCILLSIVPLVVISIIEEDKRNAAEEGNSMAMISNMDLDIQRKTLMEGHIHSSFLSSLKILGQFAWLLVPPKSVVSAANQAALKAASTISCTESYDDSTSNHCTLGNGAGTLWHLIIEACIARKLVDSSAYKWPGYVKRLAGPISQPISGQLSPWTAFMEGATLSVSLRDALIATPATSLAELEKTYKLGINGTREESCAAASILCGASLLRGWNVQEHTVRLVVKLLSHPASSDYSGPEIHLQHYAPLLQSLLKGLTSIDALHVLALYGMIPEVAAALMPICEVFGSIEPTVQQIPGKEVEVPVYRIFSEAFLLLFRLWKLYACAHVHTLTGRGAPVGSELSLEYLLHIYNSKNVKSANMAKAKNIQGIEHLQFKNSGESKSSEKISSEEPCSCSQRVVMDSFPNLKHWYSQHYASFASNASSPNEVSPAKQTANSLLNMMYWRTSRSFSSAESSSNNSGSVLARNVEDLPQRPLLPAWEILEAVPFVVDSVLTACAYGRLLPRDLITGLRELVDFLPASIATIVSYFTVEITRGSWKDVSMNGTDWPSPAANLSAIEGEIREMLANVGVTVPSLRRGAGPITLRLPLAALVSLTITSKLDKSSELFNGIAGSALEASASISPWPSTAIVSALWAQKVRRWHHLIVLYAVRTVFAQNKSAFIQLLRSCFTAALGSNPRAGSSNLKVYGGVSPLLGNSYSALSHYNNIAALGPGFFYVRIFELMYDLSFVMEEILLLVVEAARDIAPTGFKCEHTPALVSSKASLRSCSLSLTTSLQRVKLASSLGASILCISGGPKLVQLLYQETLPTWFITGGASRSDRVPSTSLEGYAVARFSFLSGIIAWGTKPPSFTKKRSEILDGHLNFIVRAISGEFCLGCGHATWRAYVLSFMAMVITCAPHWIPTINIETLKTLAFKLKTWHEPDLAMSLLERAGVRAMGAAAELVA